ncbi:MAG: hypothetical protein ACKV2V_22625 [Blastocatellia bacterium]
MQNDYTSNQPAREAPGPRPATRLYSIFAQMREASFAGRFETATGAYDFTYTPKTARLVKGKLELTGTLTVQSGSAPARTAANVRATLAAMQSGLGNVPAAIQTRASGQPASGALPITEATDNLGYAGVLYFHLSPVNAKAIGVSADLSRAQLNVRLFPLSQTERDLVVLYSDIAAALYGKRPGQTAATEPLAQLNRAFSQA